MPNAFARSFPLALRRASPGDLPSLRSLVEQSVTELLWSAYPPEDLAALLATVLPRALPSAGMLLAEIDGFAAGCVGWSRPAAPEARAEIRSLYVHPACLGRGVATRLLAAIEAECRSRGHHRLALCSTPLARSFYAARGWAEVGRDRLSSPEGGSFAVIRMTKTLAPPKVTSVPPRLRIASSRSEPCRPARDLRPLAGRPDFKELS